MTVVILWVVAYLLAVKLVEWRAGGRMRKVSGYVYLLAVTPVVIFPLVAYAGATIFLWLRGGRPCPLRTAPEFMRHH